MTSGLHAKRFRSEINIKDILDCLKDSGIIDVDKRNENLEGYFISTVGGSL